MERQSVACKMPFTSRGLRAKNSGIGYEIAKIKSDFRKLHSDHKDFVIYIDHPVFISKKRTEIHQLYFLLGEGDVQDNFNPCKKIEKNSAVNWNVLYLDQFVFRYCLDESYNRIFEVCFDSLALYTRGLYFVASWSKNQCLVE